MPGNNEKDIFYLWREYLKRSDDFMEFCEWVIERRKNPNIPVPDKFKKTKTHGAPKELFNYLTFGNLLSPYTFEEWWEYRTENINHRKAHSIPKPVEDFTEIVGDYIDRCVSRFKEREARNPSIDELKACLYASMKRLPFLYLMVDPANEDTKSQFNAILKDRKRSDSTIRSWVFTQKIRSTPMGTIRLSELEQYLKIFDLKKQGHTIRQIIEEAGTEAQKQDPDNHDTHRLFRLHLQKARKIIRNVERGIFPGKY